MIGKRRPVEKAFTIPSNENSKSSDKDSSELPLLPLLGLGWPFPLDTGLGWGTPPSNPKV